MKAQNIMNEKWDHLIILDACRADCFEAVSAHYLSGKYEQRFSNAGATPEWLFKTFPRALKKHKITYFSANPYVNSMGFNLLETSGTDYDWCAADIFESIIDMWNSPLWDAELGTLRPENVVKIYRSVPKLERTIVHFIQPHLPFLHPDANVSLPWKPIKIIRGELDEDAPKSSLKTRAYHYAFGVLPKRIFGHNNIITWRIHKLFKIEPKSRYEKLYQLGLKDRINEFYEHSVEKTLVQVERLLDEMSGRVIITADHGERLGENGKWGHRNGNDNPILTTVPWLVVDL